MLDRYRDIEEISVGFELSMGRKLFQQLVSVWKHYRSLSSEIMGECSPRINSRTDRNQSYFVECYLDAQQAWKAIETKKARGEDIEGKEIDKFIHSLSICLDQAGLQEPIIQQLKQLAFDETNSINLRSDGFALLARFCFNNTYQDSEPGRQEVVPQKANYGKAINYYCQAINLEGKKESSYLPKPVIIKGNTDLGNKIIKIILCINEEMRRLSHDEGVIAQNRIGFLALAKRDYELLLTSLHDYIYEDKRLLKACQVIAQNHFLANKRLFSDNRAWGRAIYSALINILFLICTGFIIGPAIKSRVSESPFLGSGFFKANYTRTQRKLSEHLRHFDAGWESSPNPTV
ncbi:MAG TPA: hypothetical protein VD770_04435 [Coxiellaceae bacterium]|nr:hypothetical protein [Coxiellaceae bacterium]